jgi:hypothetical protein
LIVLVKDSLDHGIGRIVEPAFGFCVGSVECPAQFRSVAADPTPSMRIAAMVRVPISVQRQILSRHWKVPPILKSECFIRYMKAL